MAKRKQRLVDQAREFAIKAHGDQRYGDEPYIVHLDAVANVLVEFGIRDGVFLAGAFLHDVIEDTGVTRDDLAREFGFVVAGLVWVVTNEPGANRKERAAKTYPKIRRSGAEAVRLKLADRIANTHHSIVRGTRHLEMYRKEFPAFHEALYRAGECDDMWERLRYLTLGIKVPLPETGGAK